MGAEASRDEVEVREDASGERASTNLRRGRAHILQGVAHATRELRGDDALARAMSELPSEIGDSLTRPADEWVPVEHIVSFIEATLGPLDDAKLRESVRLTMDHKWSRARRLLLAIATPSGIVRRASELFRQDFSDGRAVAYMTSPCSAVVTLHDHHFAETPLLRTIAAETVRYALQLSGATDVTEHHTDDDGPLVVRLTWG